MDDKRGVHLILRLFYFCTLWLECETKPNRDSLPTMHHSAFILSFSLSLSFSHGKVWLQERLRHLEKYMHKSQFSNDMLTVKRSWKHFDLLFSSILVQILWIFLFSISSNNLRHFSFWLFSPRCYSSHNRYWFEKKNKQIKMQNGAKWKRMRSRLFCIA